MSGRVLGIATELPAYVLDGKDRSRMNPRSCGHWFKRAYRSNDQLALSFGIYVCVCVCVLTCGSRLDYFYIEKTVGGIVGERPQKLADLEYRRY